MIRRARILVGCIFSAGAVTACQPDMAAWRNHLAEPAVARLAGAWTIELRADGGVFGRDGSGARASGVLDLVLNRERVTTTSSQPPVAFGVYDVALAALGIGTGEAATPDAWVEWQADSVIMTLSPKAKWPIRLAGAWSGDSLVGRWRAWSQPGPGGIGDFVIRRR